MCQYNGMFLVSGSGSVMLAVVVAVGGVGGLLAVVA